MINSYKDLIVWQKSISLVREIYLITKSFPKDEQFGLISQLRRASVSIPSNIAEGYGRKTKNDRMQFYIIAYSSALEIETQLIISIQLGFLSAKNAEKAQGVLLEVLKMLNSLTSGSRSNN